jgi:hypothetical protein
MWTGMAFVYVRVCVTAIWYGRDRKPRYQVTRKERRPGLYLGFAAPQGGVLALPAKGVAPATRALPEFGRVGGCG